MAAFNRATYRTTSYSASVFKCAQLGDRLMDSPHLKLFPAQFEHAGHAGSTPATIPHICIALLEFAGQRLKNAF